MNLIVVLARIIGIISIPASLLIGIFVAAFGGDAPGSLTTLYVVLSLFVIYVVLTVICLFISFHHTPYAIFIPAIFIAAEAFLIWLLVTLKILK